MNKEQQIEETIKIVKKSINNNAQCDAYETVVEIYCDDEENIAKEAAEAIYNAGYRKIDENCAVITKDDLKLYQRQAVKEFAERLKKDPRINNYGLEFVALVDIDAELKALLKEYEKK